MSTNKEANEKYVTKINYAHSIIPKENVSEKIQIFTCLKCSKYLQNKYL